MSPPTVGQHGETAASHVVWDRESACAAVVQRVKRWKQWCAMLQHVLVGNILLNIHMIKAF